MTMHHDVKPLYQQVKDHILDQITSNEWPIGHKIPSENQLVRDFGISRMTINRAVKELTSEGYLSRVIGVGTFVQSVPWRSSLIEVRNIADEIESRGHRHSARVISSQEVTARAELANRFEEKEGVRLFHIALVHSQNDTPVQLEERFVNPLVAPEFLDQDFTAITPTEYLLRLANVDELEHVVQAIMPTGPQRRYLQIAPDEPCLSLLRRSWSGGRVVTAATLIYPASRYELRSRYQPPPHRAVTTAD